MERLDTNVDAIQRSSTSLHLSLGRFFTPWHNHKKRHQLLYPTQGVVHLLTQEARLLLPAKHGALIPAGTLHRLESRSAAMQLRTIYFQAQVQDPIELQQLKIFPIDKLGQEMISYTARWTAQMPESALEMQIIRTLRLLVLDWCHSSLPLSLPASDHKRLNEVTDYIHDHLADKLPLKVLAQSFGFSERSLIRLFIQHLGINFGAYKNVARMIKAAEMLSEPGVKVGEVMYLVGFESPSAFSRRFKQFLGVSPRSYTKAQLLDS